MRRSDARIAAYGILAAIIILVVGFLASLVAGTVPQQSGTVNVFLDNLESIPVVLARTAPWAALLEIVCVLWIWFANRLFRRWNDNVQCEEQGTNCGKGLVHEIAHDNNAAATLLVLMPLLILGIMLIYESILNK